MSNTTPKARQPRLRASCDGCFLAKVKCSKDRPICSRCLTNGQDCRYSPSSRAGKPKSDGSSNRNNRASTISDSMRGHASTYELDNGWNNPGDLGGSMPRNTADLGLFGMAEHALPALGSPVGMYPGCMPWPSPTDFSQTSFGEASMTSPYLTGQNSRSSSMDPSMAAQLSAWAESAAQDAICLSTPSASSINMSTPRTTYLPSPSGTPNGRPGTSHEASLEGATSPPGDSCNCFTVCLESLHALHGASAPDTPSFDVVLSLNKKAVEGCAAMLACGRCMSRPGTHTTAMLLATMIGKITTFYKHASHSHFETGPEGTRAPGRLNSPGAGLSVSVGAYTLGEEDGRWLELELLARELRKLEELYLQFRKVCADLTEDPEVCRVVVGYLEHNLGRTLEVVNHRKGS